MATFRMENIHMYKKIAALFIATLFVCTISVGAEEKLPAPAKPAQPLNRIAAIVNDEVIPESDVDGAIAAYKEQLLANKMPLPSEETIRKDALNQVINYRLQLQLAARAGIKPTEDEINNGIIQIAKSHRLTIDELRNQLSIQNTPWDSFRQKIAEDITISKVQQQAVAPDVKITDAEVAAYRQKYEAEQQTKLIYHLLDFMVPLPEQPTNVQVDAALTKAREISMKLNNGATIAEVNSPYQDLGWSSKSDMPELFALQIDQLNEKNASKPLRAPNGFHVIKLVEAKAAPALPLLMIKFVTIFFV